jgi:hypothetical protein
MRDQNQKQQQQQAVNDEENRDDEFVEQVGRRMILPSTHPGSMRNMRQRYKTNIRVFMR